MNHRDGGDDDDDVPQLSAAALAALQEFYAENGAGPSALRDSYTVGAIKEDWVSGGVFIIALYSNVCSIFAPRA